MAYLPTPDPMDVINSAWKIVAYVSFGLNTLLSTVIAVLYLKKDEFKDKQMELLDKMSECTTHMDDQLNKVQLDLDSSNQHVINESKECKNDILNSIKVISDKITEFDKSIIQLNAVVTHSLLEDMEKTRKSVNIMEKMVIEMKTNMDSTNFEEMLKIVRKTKYEVEKIYYKLHPKNYRNTLEEGEDYGYDY